MNIYWLLGFVKQPNKSGLYETPKSIEFENAHTSQQSAPVSELSM